MEDSADASGLSSGGSAPNKLYVERIQETAGYGGDRESGRISPSGPGRFPIINLEESVRQTNVVVGLGNDKGDFYLFQPLLLKNKY